MPHTMEAGKAQGKSKLLSPFRKLTRMLGGVKGSDSGADRSSAVTTCSDTHGEVNHVARQQPNGFKTHAPLLHSLSDSHISGAAEGSAMDQGPQHLEASPSQPKVVLFSRRSESSHVLLNRSLVHKDNVASAELERTQCFTEEAANIRPPSSPSVPLGSPFTTHVTAPSSSPQHHFVLRKAVHATHSAATLLANLGSASPSGTSVVTVRADSSTFPPRPNSGTLSPSSSRLGLALGLGPSTASSIHGPASPTPKPSGSHRKSGVVVPLPVQRSQLIHAHTTQDQGLDGAPTNVNVERPISALQRFVRGVKAAYSTTSFNAEQQQLQRPGGKAGAGARLALEEDILPPMPSCNSVSLIHLQSGPDSPFTTLMQALAGGKADGAAAATAQRGGANGGKRTVRATHSVLLPGSDIPRLPQVRPPSSKVLPLPLERPNSRDDHGLDASPPPAFGGGSSSGLPQFAGAAVAPAERAAHPDNHMPLLPGQTRPHGPSASRLDIAIPSLQVSPALVNASFASPKGPNAGKRQGSPLAPESLDVVGSPAPQPPTPAAAQALSPAPAPAAAAGASSQQGPAAAARSTPAASKPAPAAPTAATRLLSMSPGLPTAMRRRKWNIDDYQLTKTLYKGEQTAVFKALCLRSQIHVALKVYFKAAVPQNALHMVMREIDIHTMMNHPNIIMLYAAFEDDEHIVLVQEYAAYGDMYALHRRLGGRMTEAQVAQLVLPPFLQALKFLHAKGICHRDIKPENILFTEDWTLKLADFGVAIDLQEERAVTRAGTYAYMAPEVYACPLKAHRNDNKDDPSLAYGPAADVWSVGVLAYEMLVGFPPYSVPPAHAAGGEARDAQQQQPQPPVRYPAFLSEPAKAFMKAALSDWAGDRPTAHQLLDHPWLSRASRSKA